MGPDLVAKPIAAILKGSVRPVRRSSRRLDASRQGYTPPPPDRAHGAIDDRGSGLLPADYRFSFITDQWPAGFLSAGLPGRSRLLMQRKKPRNAWARSRG